jgi:DNA-binding response OmpR family regulator
MPGQDGLTIAREIRAKSDVGIIMLTGRDELLDRVVGLEVGADDYIAQPFHLREVGLSRSDDRDRVANDDQSCPARPHSCNWTPPDRAA